VQGWSWPAVGQIAAGIILAGIVLGVAGMLLRA
jgi:hypothetical protein